MIRYESSSAEEPAVNWLNFENSFVIMTFKAMQHTVITNVKDFIVLLL